MGLLAFGSLFFLAVVTVGIATTIFWIVELVVVLTKETDQGNMRLIWFLVIFFGHVLGAILYYFVRRPERIATLGR